MLIAQYFVEFIFFSFLGWVWESVYCTVKEKHWQDRGFLLGPVCPIYGISVIAVFAIFRYIPHFSENPAPVWEIFLICMTGSAVLEYTASWILEKKYHARWWDYSQTPLNINGRICLPASIGFGLAGIVVVRYMLPTASCAQRVISGDVTVVIALILAVLFGVDLALTQASLTELLSDVEQFKREFDAKAEDTYVRIQQTPRQIGEAKDRLVETAAETKDRLVETAAEAKDRLVETAAETKDRLAGTAAETKDRLVETAAETKNRLTGTAKEAGGKLLGIAGIAEKTAGSAIGSAAQRGRRLQMLAVRHVQGLSAGSRHILRNIVSFRPGNDAGRYEGKTAEEQMQETLKKIDKAGKS